MVFPGRQKLPLIFVPRRDILGLVYKNQDTQLAAPVVSGIFPAAVPPTSFMRRLTVSARFSLLWCAAAIALLPACGAPPAAAPTSAEPTAAQASAPAASYVPPSPPATPDAVPAVAETEDVIDTSAPVSPPASPALNASPVPAPSAHTGAGPSSAAWLDCTDVAVFGMEEDAACPLSVADARVGLNDFSVALVPQGTASAMSAFIEADTRIPRTEVSYSESNHALVIRMRDTTLDTGDPADAAGSDDWVYDFIEEFAFDYPSSFPMGSLGADNGFFQNAAISSDGTDTVITLLLTERAEQFRVESGSLDRAEMHPWFRLTFREAE